jgi:cell wall-associated NlpC family hydrolase
MQPGDLVLVKGTSWRDHIVEDIEGSPYSHVAIIVSDDLVIEDLPFYGVKYTVLSFYRGEDVFTYPPVTGAQRDGIVSWAEAHLGDQYAWSLLGWELIRYTLHQMLPWYVLPGRFMCSTFCSDAYMANGIDPWNVKYPSPADVADDLVKIGVVPYGYS